MSEDEALELILSASRVINRYQYGMDVPKAEAGALRHLAQTDAERSLPLDKLASPF